MAATTDLTCSFCQQICEASQLVTGDLGARICVRCLRGHRDSMSGLASTTDEPHVVELDAEQMLRTLPMISAEAVHMDRFLRQRVALIRSQNISYQQIGQALGVSRQAAWERFSRSVVELS